MTRRTRSHSGGIERRQFLVASGGVVSALVFGNANGGCSEAAGALPERDAPDAPQTSETSGHAGVGGDAGVSTGTSRAAGGDAGGADTRPMAPVAAPVDSGRAPGAPIETTSDPFRLCAPDGQGGELIVDMNTTFFELQENPLGITADPGLWVDARRYPLADFTSDVCDLNGPRIRCYGLDSYSALVYGRSDTSIALLSGLPYVLGEDGSGASGVASLLTEELLAGAEIIGSSHPGRVLRSVPIMPGDRLELQLLRMDRLAHVTECWSTNPAWSPLSNGGFRLDDEVGRAMIRRGLDLERPFFLVHKGPSMQAPDPRFTSPADVGPAARMFPEAHIVVQTAAFEHGMDVGWTTAPSTDPEVDLGWGMGVGLFPEGPYDEQDVLMQERYPLERGVNSLIKSLRDNDIGANGRDLSMPNGPVTTRVYADCSSAWPALARNRENEAMHFWGKLLKHLGEDRILWSTGALSYGGPQPYIDAFRRFEISEEFQQEFGYPALTPACKEKILGGNAAKMLNILPGVEIQGCHRDVIGARRLSRRALLRLA